MTRPGKRERIEHGELLGSLEHIVLLALMQLGGPAHGALIQREIEARTTRDLSIGAIYATLERLQEKGYVSSTLGDPTPERGGRAKRLFCLEAPGKRSLQVSARTLLSMGFGGNLKWRPT
jgi:PadR family transcriptional regulator, regulatory protein PadR